MSRGPYKGLGLANPLHGHNDDLQGDDHAFAHRNQTYWGPGPGDGERFEKRNAENKHQVPHRARYGNYEDPMSTEENRAMRRRAYQKMAADDPSWASGARQESAVKFEEDFKAAMDSVDGIYDDPDDYSRVNYKRWRPLADQWRRRARDYGLSEEEAEEIMSSFAED